MADNFKKDEVQAFRPITANNQIVFEHPLEDVFTAQIPISSCGWIKTTDGVVVVDTLLRRKFAREIYKKIKEIEGNNKIKYVILTHGHLDHVMGVEAFLPDNPEVISSDYLPARLDNYKMLAQHRNRIAAQQFALPEVVISKEIQDNIKYPSPTKTFLGELTFKLGDKTFELHTERAETDDAVWMWVPELKAAFIGDLLIRSFPNVGNPWKPTRFALGWINALKRIREKNSEYIFFGGGGNLHKGKDLIKIVLDHTIEALTSLHDQVVDLINQDVHITEMIHRVKLPDHLKNSPHLQSSYSRPEFFVFNVYRWYHGYFDGNPAHLLPRPQKEVNTEIFKLIGDPIIILNKARELLVNNQAQLGLEVLDVLIQAQPDNIEARKFRIELLKVLGNDDNCLMSRNAWSYFIKKDEEFLKSKRG